MSKEVLEVLRAAIASNTPVLLWGDSGAGKTALIEAEAREHGAKLITRLASQMDPVDMGEYLAPDVNGRIVGSPPPLAVEIREALDRGKDVWLFLDELSNGSPSQQAAILRAVNEREIAGVSIAECRMIGASNPEGEAADNGYMAPAAALRWVHLDYVPDPQAWSRGELSGWGEKRSKEHNEVAAIIASFISRRPSALTESRDDKAKWSGRGARRPRTWSRAAKLISMLPGASAKDKILSTAGLLTLNGSVGETGAGELLNYVKTLDLRDPEDYLSGKEKLPKRADLYAAALDSVVSAVISNPTKNRIDQAWTIVSSARPDCAINPAKVLREQWPNHPLPDCAMQFGDKLAEFVL